MSDEIPDVSFALVVTRCCQRIVGDTGNTEKCPFCGKRPLMTSRYTKEVKLRENICDVSNVTEE